MDNESGSAAQVEVKEVDAAVIGAGIAGLYAVHKLRNELQLQVQAFDAAEGIGGTWWWNCYPGARSDIESTAYCFAFDPDLSRKWKWSARYPRQDEILAYLDKVVDRYDLRRSIKLGTTIERAWFDEDRRRWQLLTDAGERWSAQFLIECVGILAAVNVPPFPGLESYRGDVFHTSRWPREPVDFSGKRVGVIGTGSTGVQVIVELATLADHLTVFQRSPQYTVPARHGPIDQATVQRMAFDHEAYWAEVRATRFAGGFAEGEISALSVSDAEREEILERSWQRGGALQFMFGNFNDILINAAANDLAADFVRRKIAGIVEDPATARKLTPQEPYARRPICCDNYYETFNRQNVTLVDLKADPIVEITTEGIRTKSGEHQLDAIVLATGFDAVSGTFLKIDQRGRGGESLRERWADRPRSCLGLMTAGFPNMFMSFGPMSAAGNHFPVMEIQMDWITEVIEMMRGQGLETIEPTEESEAAWVELCDGLSEDSLFMKVRSWANGGNIEGRRPMVLLNMGGVANYIEHLRDWRQEIETRFTFTSPDPSLALGAAPND